MNCGTYIEVLGIVHVLEDGLVDGLLHDALLPPLVTASGSVEGELAGLGELLNACFTITLMQHLIHQIK